jgi:hypothetical protein
MVPRTPLIPLACRGTWAEATVTGNQKLRQLLVHRIFRVASCSGE